MARTAIRLAVVVAATVLLAACDLFPKTWQWNQKLTLEVATPQGIRSGSAVTHVSWQDVNAVGNYPSSYSGEATVVEVAPGRYLFALIGEKSKYIAQYTFHEQFGTSRADYQKLLPEIEKFRGTADVPRDRYPLLVTFADIADPKTVQKVDPDNLAASFGPGVSLKRITLEITDEKVTQKIETLLPWLEKVGRERGTLIPNPPRMSTSLTNPEIQLLAPSAFSTELYK